MTDKASNRRMAVSRSRAIASLERTLETLHDVIRQNELLAKDPMYRDSATERIREGEAENERANEGLARLRPAQGPSDNKRAGRPRLAGAHCGVPTEVSRLAETREPDSSAPTGVIARPDRPLEVTGMSLLTITVIDDDPDMLAMLEEICRDHFGGRVHLHALSALPTIDALAATAPRVVVLDLLLGEDHTGVELMRAMRRDRRLARVPILVVTASRQGMEHYLDEAPWPKTAILLKPFGLAHFHEALDALLSGRSRPPPVSEDWSGAGLN